jgi:hypothetical protein
MNDQYKSKTTGQVRAIYAESAKHGVDQDTLRDIVADVTRRTRSVKALTYIEAQRVLQRLKGKSFVPLRTLQYRRQKAGVPQLVTREQLDLIAELASQREWSVETLAKFCKRVCKREVPRTTADANKVIEGLKSMKGRIMVSSIDTATLRDKVNALAHELADAHAAMKPQQRSTEFGQGLFRAKNMAYGLLREIEVHELNKLFNRRPQPFETDNSPLFVNLEPRSRSRFAIVRKLRAIFSH